MQIVNAMKKRIPELRTAYEKRSVFYYVFPTVMAVIFILYYAPIFGVVGVPEYILMEAGDMFYDTVDLFRAAPVITGVTALLTLILYKESFWKIFFGAIYIVSLLPAFIPVLMVMEFTDMKELMVYFIHVVIIGLAVFILILDKRMNP